MEIYYGATSPQLHSPQRNILFVFLISAICSFAPVRTSPNHNELQALTPISYADQGSKTCYDIYPKVAFQSIRIGFRILEEYVDPAGSKLKKYIEKTVMASAANYFSNVLKVRRHAVPLKPKTDKCGSAVKIPADIISSGVKDVDFFAFVTIKSFNSCSGSTLAYASYCVKDQCDRPIFAHINFCPEHPKYGDKKNRDDHIATAIHELTHALVFSSELFPYFRNSDGTAKLPRDPSYSFIAKDRIRYQCDKGQIKNWNADKSVTPYHSYVDISQKGMVKVFKERDMDNCPCPIGRPDIQPGCTMPEDSDSFREPRCVVKMLTPKVVEKAKEFFGCDNLEGPELENQDTGACSIVGSHWEQRLFMGELMASTTVDNFNIYVSPVTLALFEDSGWYQPDYTLADSLTKGVHWGYKLGCGFARQKCVVGGVTSFPRLWCTEHEQQVCDAGRTEVRMCKLNQLSVSSKPVDYFAGKNLVGHLPQADYCPNYMVSSRTCNDVSTPPIFGPLNYNNVNFMREIIDDKSKCLESTLYAEKIPADSGRVYNFPHDKIKVNAGQEYPNCYKIECAADKKSYKVWILDMEDKHVELGSCNKEDQQLKPKPELKLVKGYVKCADPVEICGIELPVYLGGPGAGGKAVIPRRGGPGGGRRPGSSLDDDEDDEDGENDAGKKNGLPWGIIGIVGGVVLLLLILAAVMCCGRGSRGAQSKGGKGAARDVKKKTKGGKGEGVQLSVNVNINNPWNHNGPATQPLAPKTSPAGGWKSQQMAPQAPQYPSTMPPGSSSSPPSWGMVPMSSQATQPQMGNQYSQQPMRNQQYGGQAQQQQYQYGGPRSHPFRQ